MPNKKAVLLLFALVFLTCAGAAHVYAKDTVFPAAPRVPGPSGPSNPVVSTGSNANPPWADCRGVLANTSSCAKNIGIDKWQWSHIKRTLLTDKQNNKVIFYNEQGAHMTPAQLSNQLPTQCSGVGCNVAPGHCRVTTTAGLACAEECNIPEDGCAKSACDQRMICDPKPGQCVPVNIVGGLGCIEKCDVPENSCIPSVCVPSQKVCNLPHEEE